MDHSFKVSVNDEAQYSIVPVDFQNPPGWADTGFRGSRQQCIDYVNVVWTDLRPRSLRLLLAARASPNRAAATDDPDQVDA